MKADQAGRLCAVLTSLCFAVHAAGCGPATQAAKADLPAARTDLPANQLPTDEVKREFRAAFVTVAFNKDWPRKTDKGDMTAQVKDIRTIIERARKLNFNVLLLQVRAFSDSIYLSQLQGSDKPDRSRFIANAADYDPLKIWVQECHDNGIELHAWVNPFRGKKSDTWEDPTDSKVHDKLADKVIDELINYGVPWTKAASAMKADATATSNASAQPTTKEDDDGIDGVIIDHYVPDPGDGGMMKSEAGQEKPVAKLTTKGKKDEVTKFMRRVQTKVKTRRWIKFGISPERNPFIPGISDVPTWLKDRVCDYMVPELYIKGHGAGSDFNGYLTWYLREPMADGKPRPLIVAGLYTVRVQKPESPVLGPWNPREILDQVTESRTLFDTERTKGGQAHFAWSALRPDGEDPPAHADIGKMLQDEPYANQALVPVCVEKPPHTPPAVAFDAPQDLGNEYSISWHQVQPNRRDAWLWEFWQRDAGTGKWSVKIMARGEKSAKVPKGKVNAVAARAVDQWNQEGALSGITVP